MCSCIFRETEIKFYQYERHNFTRSQKHPKIFTKKHYKESPIMKLQIGENIKSLRKAANITQETLAEMLGVSCQSVSRWELGVSHS